VVALALTVLLARVWSVLGGVWWAGAVTGIAALAAAALVTGWCVRRLGGVTGDVMGAAVEVTFTVLLLGACAVGGWA